MKITKKVKKEYFDAIIDGRKRYEVRLADFEYKPGDTIELVEQGDKDELTGRKIECEILHDINTKIAEKFWPKEDIDKYGLVILSIRKKFTFD